MDLIEKGINPITFHGLRLSITSDESRAINFDDKPKVILSAVVCVMQGGLSII